MRTIEAIGKEHAIQAFLGLVQSPQFYDALSNAANIMDVFYQRLPDGTKFGREPERVSEMYALMSQYADAGFGQVITSNFRQTPQNVTASLRRPATPQVPFVRVGVHSHQEDFDPRGNSIPLHLLRHPFTLTYSVGGVALAIHLANTGYDPYVSEYSPSDSASPVHFLNFRQYRGLTRFNRQKSTELITLIKNAKLLG